MRFFSNHHHLLRLKCQDNETKTTVSLPDTRQASPDKKHKCMPTSRQLVHGRRTWDTIDYIGPTEGIALQPQVGQELNVHFAPVEESGNRGGR